MPPNPLELSSITSLKRPVVSEKFDYSIKRTRAQEEPYPPPRLSVSSILEMPTSAFALTSPSTSSSSQARPTAKACAPTAQPPKVGNQQLHASHTLEHKRGIILCQRCGYYTISKAGKLAHPCAPITPGVKSGGRDYLSRWAKGLTPRKSVDWPNAFSHLPDGVIWRSQS